MITAGIKYKIAEGEFRGYSFTPKYFDHGLGSWIGDLGNGYWVDCKPEQLAYWTDYDEER